MKKIRHNVFETNSSSTHSLSINDDSILLDTIIPDEYGIVTINGGEFGWEWEKFNDAYTKASYALTGVLYVEDRETALSTLHDVIREHTLAEVVELVLDTTKENYDVYIDHQSVEDGEMNNLLFDKTRLHNFIFNKNSWLFLGNDNSSAPNKFYDTKEKVYKYKLVFDDYPISTWEFVEYPSFEKIRDVITNMNIRFRKRGNTNTYYAEERASSWSSTETYYEFSNLKSKLTDTKIEFRTSYDNKKNKSLFIKYSIKEI